MVSGWQGVDLKTAFSGSMGWRGRLSLAQCFARLPPVLKLLHIPGSSVPPPPPSCIASPCQALGYPAALIAKGPDVPFLAGGPFMSTGPQVSGAGCVGQGVWKHQHTANAGPASANAGPASSLADCT